MEFRTRLEQHWENMLSFASRRRLRNFGAGIAFGGMLTFFALGSLGMTTPPEKVVKPVWEQASAKNITTETTEAVGSVAWRALASKLSEDRPATLEDLRTIGMLFMREFESLPTDDPSGFQSCQHMADRLFPVTMSDENTGQPLKRSTMTLFFFQVLREIFRMPIPNVKQSSCVDVPRFHMFHLPIETLRSLHLDPCRSEDTFGDADHVNLQDLIAFTSDFIKLGEAHKANRD